MKYLVVDAAVAETGIRDKYNGGYLSPEELGLPSDTCELIQNWLLKYEAECFSGYIHEEIVTKLDQEGREIALMIKNELREVKLEYFSDARMTLEII
jgi:hypothetical protein